MDASRVVTLASNARVSSRHHVLTFEDPLTRSYEPGQFVMVWIPGVDELPMALWGDGRPFKLLVEAKGDGTKALCALAPGSKIGVRGPYGRPFQVRGRRILAVVGGTGTAPLVPFCERARGRAEVDLVLGARSKEFVLLRREFEAAGARVHVSTDDGTDGFHGRAPDLASRLAEGSTFDQVVTCGPERMMKAVVEWARARRIPVQASVERWMKCAVGVCDACLVDDVRLCRDGPVLEGDVLARLSDFGRSEREPSGLRRPLH